MEILTSMFSLGLVRALRGLTYTSVSRCQFHYITYHSFSRKFKCIGFKVVDSNRTANSLHKRNIRISSKHLSNGIRKAGILYIQNPFRWLNVRLDLYVLKTKWDPEFSLSEFVFGTKQAVCTVMNFIARRKECDLRGLIHKTVMDKLIGYVINEINSQNIEIVALEPEDIYVAFPHEVHFHEIAEKRYCDIDMIFICVTLRNTPYNNIQVLEVGARFHREYTEGALPDWTVTKLEVRKHSKES